MLPILPVRHCLRLLAASGGARKLIVMQPARAFCADVDFTDKNRDAQRWKELPEGQGEARDYEMSRERNDEDVSRRSERDVQFSRKDLSSLSDEAVRASRAARFEESLADDEMPERREEWREYPADDDEVGKMPERARGEVEERGGSEYAAGMMGTTPMAGGKAGMRMESILDRSREKGEQAFPEVSDAFDRLGPKATRLVGSIDYAVQKRREATASAGGGSSKPGGTRDEQAEAGERRTAGEAGNVPKTGGVKKVTSAARVVPDKVVSVVEDWIGIQHGDGTSREGWEGERGVGLAAEVKEQRDLQRAEAGRRADSMRGAGGVREGETRPSDVGLHRAQEAHARTFLDETAAREQRDVREASEQRHGEEADVYVGENMDVMDRDTHQRRRVLHDTLEKSQAPRGTEGNRS